MGSNAAEVAAEMLAFAHKLKDEFDATIETQMTALADEVRSQAPVDTGAYRSSIRATRDAVVTDAPQANRLEFGYNGVDAKGRRYHNPPQPHFRAGVAKRADKIRKAIVDSLRRAAGGS